MSNGTPTNKISFSWSTIESDIIKLANTIQAKKKYTGLVIVSRGGLAIGAMISRILDIKLVDIISVYSYSNHNTQESELTVLKQPELALKTKGENWLVVDDLIDSGDTYIYIKEILPLADFACLYNKTNSSKYMKDVMYAQNCDKNSWIEFPWETFYNQQ